MKMWLLRMIWLPIPQIRVPSNRVKLTILPYLRDLAREGYALDYWKHDDLNLSGLTTWTLHYLKDFDSLWGGGL